MLNSEYYSQRYTSRKIECYILKGGSTSGSDQFKSNNYCTIQKRILSKRINWRDSRSVQMKWKFRRIWNILRSKVQKEITMTLFPDVKEISLWSMNEVFRKTLVGDSGCVVSSAMALNSVEGHRLSRHGIVG